MAWKKVTVQRMFSMGSEGSGQGLRYDVLFNPSRRPSISNSAKLPTQLALVPADPLDHDTVLDRTRRICSPVSLILRTPHMGSRL